jgi:hypothetical protein
LQDDLRRLDRQAHRAKLALQLFHDPRLAAENASKPLVPVPILAILLY